jgi:Rps23 Pro-64 3,4-dihydroxylase Tpa1-like proline 4-hydroxylase
MIEDLLLIEEFLAPAEMGALWAFAMSREPDFVASEVLGDHDESRRDQEFRRSRVLFDVADVQPLVADRVLGVLPHVLDRLGMAPFTVRDIELQVTASNDSEWFRAHHDTGHGPVATRELTFVYYCHREPRPFTGGELRMYGPVGDAAEPEAQSRAQTITPRQNSIVFFPSHYLHEVLPTQCQSRQFADSRLTFNGWLHR